MATETQDYLTTAQIAARLHVKPNTILEYAKSGRIPCVRVSRRVVLFEWEKVRVALDRQSVRETSDPDGA